ncbi:fatty acid desaturase family protein [Sandarakinorhabdus glacialis]|nr:fatty acid desaturase [Polymorphobacter glacialis]
MMNSHRAIPIPGTDDADMIRTAAKLTRELNAAKPAIYWADFLASSFIGYTGLGFAIGASGWLQAAGVLVAILALYRAGSFIHELTHLKPSAVPGFRTAWNLIIGVPLLVPSFMYDGVHNLHHARTRYGTSEDPEYLPLALMPPQTLALFVVVSILAPIALLLRFGILAPLSLVSPRLRRLLTERYSALSINPAFRRKQPDGDFARHWALWETLASLWAITLLVTTATGILPLPAFLTGIGIASAVTLLNQVRTLVAHLWENDGEAISVTAQYLDTVNVPPPSYLPALWAPVGLRYHALHHLLPGVPYHNLAEAHRRLITAMPATSAYHTANHPGLSGLVAKLVTGSIKATRPR